MFMNENSKVLLIEDDETLLDSTKDFLEEEGFITLTAKNGLDGIQKAITNLPNIILADIAMPKLDGYQVYRTLQENPDTSVIPFVFITAKTSKEDIRAGMQIIMSNIMEKFQKNTIEQMLMGMELLIMMI